MTSAQIKLEEIKKSKVFIFNNQAIYFSDGSILYKNFAYSVWLKNNL